MGNVVWKTIQCKGNVPPNRAFHGCTLINEYEMFILGGCDNSKDLLDAYVLNLSRNICVSIGTNKWKKLCQIESNFHFPLVGFGIVTLPQHNRFLAEQILVFGGWEGKSYSNKTMLIDRGSILYLYIGLTELRTGSGSFQKTSPSPRRDMTFTYSPYDNKVYLYGGWNPLSWIYHEAFSNELWTLDSRNFT